MKQFLFLVVSSLLTSGCYYTSSYASTLHNTVVFDSSFSPIEKRYIMNGFNVWGQETNCDVLFEEKEGGRIEIKRSTYEDNQKFDKQFDGDVIGLSVKGNHPQIYFAMDRLNTLGDLELVAAHEAGHHLGMDHVPQDELAIMNPVEPAALVRDIHLTQYDLDQFNNFWKCK